MQYKNYWITVVSSNRPNNVIPMTNIIGKATWYTKDTDNYKNCDVVKVENGHLTKQRNRALQDAIDKNLICVQISDDLQYIKDVNENVIEFYDCLDVIRQELDKTDFKLAGVAPTTNKYYYNENKKISYKSFIIADLILIKPTHLRFDEYLKTKDDYDFTMQNIYCYGGVVRHNGIMAKFKHYKNKGGVVDYRTSQLESEHCDYLLNKWKGKGLIRNGRRENELIIRIKNII